MVRLNLRTFIEVPVKMARNISKVLTEVSTSLKTESMRRCLLQEVAGVFSRKCAEHLEKSAMNAFLCFFYRRIFLKWRSTSVLS